MKCGNQPTSRVNNLSPLITPPSKKAQNLCINKKNPYLCTQTPKPQPMRHTIITLLLLLCATHLPAQTNTLTFTVNGVTFNMKKVEGGTFMMGATSEQQKPDDVEKPTHHVTLSSYYIGETEVTQALWKAVMHSNPSFIKGDNLPVGDISWNDCQTFIRKLNSLTGKTFRLPTEAEWEFAARGGNKSRHTQYSGSDKTADVAWYDKNSKKQPHPVKTKQANELGIYDMSGNVFEWCQDWYGEYDSESQDDSTGPVNGTKRVMRGGSYATLWWAARISFRYYESPDETNPSQGLRLALSE